MNTPLTVPTHEKKWFEKNYSRVTRNTGNLFLFAGDQKIEHLNQDFYGEGIPEECGNPEHLFNIASSSDIGVFATQLGMIARYGRAQTDVDYLVKLNSKTNIIATKDRDPINSVLATIEDVVRFKEQSGLSIVGVGCTLYLGSEYEPEMMAFASDMVQQAHQHGLITVIWMYPRGRALKNEKSADLIAGAAGVATALGADFVKLVPPQAPDTKTSARLLVQATQAAGNTGVICSGGSKMEKEGYLKGLREQIEIGQARGCAVGRNVHQLSLADAQKMCSQIASIVYGEHK